MSMNTDRMNEIERIFELQRSSYHSMRHTSARQRIRRLREFQTAILSNRRQLEEALYADLGKSEMESGLMELMVINSEIKHVCQNLESWMLPQPVDNPVVFSGSRGEIQYEPKGLVLILSPWNYPFMLAAGPLISAVAAGNCVVLKPSEISSNTSAFLKEMISSVFPESEVAVVEGDASVATRLLEMPFHHIFFTGSTTVGKVVMQAAARHLASVTLELGGKSPAIIDPSYDMKAAARKIMWGKLVNAGQSCVATDFVLVPESRVPAFVRLAKEAASALYPNPSMNDSYGRVIHKGHASRLHHLIEEAVSRGARIESGGEVDMEKLYVEPTILTQVPLDSKVMNEEIFGPVLPVFSYHGPEEAIAFVQRFGRPLALYLFSDHAEWRDKMIRNIQSGGVCLNETVVHFAHPLLPFGGLNSSGFGNAHGFFGFRAFSHERAVLKQPKHGTMTFLYPPYTKWKKRLLDLTIKFF